MYCVIMAGGSGTRFWPRSRENRSKQFLAILGDQTLIQNTIKRCRDLVEVNNIFIVAKKSQKKLIETHLSSVPVENLIYEPDGKNTAPCIGLAALFVQKKDRDGIMVITPADHLIRKVVRFHKTIRYAVELAKIRSCLVTVGIYPTHPATGFGYIQIDSEVENKEDIKSYRIKTFAEKPNLETARRFLESGDFYWNSGIFIFKASVYLKMVEEFLPEVYDGLMEIKKSIGKSNYEEVLYRVYRQIRSISIDYGIMEKTKNVCMVEGDFLWSDLGSWEQVFKLSSKDNNGNRIEGNAVLIDTKNSYIYSDKGVIAVIGLEDVVIVNDGGATLICNRERAEDVKSIVNQLKHQKFHKYI